MRVLAIEPYATPSHLSFLEGLARCSRHEVRLATLPARSWKWRMGTASLHFARAIEREGPFDLLFASDYLDLARTLALLPRREPRPPAVVYFHENQLTYPLQEGERRDVHFAVTHLHAIRAAELALFNSEYHRRTFLAAARELFGKAADVDLGPDLDDAEAKSSVLPVGVDVPRGEPSAPTEAPTILWPHRWEYDKDPDAFHAALVELAGRDVPFRLRLAGQRFRERPPALDAIERDFADRIDASGFADRAGYLATLAASDVVVSTAKHEFFGLATLEALRAGALPVLPDDLAYPELLPEDLRRPPYLVPQAASFAEALESALDVVRRGALGEERRALVRSTDRFVQETLASRYDDAFERAAR